jgi:hypothetical protein
MAREYGTDPYGIIARGVPGERSASPVSFGGVGSPVRSLVSPGQSFGTGVGARFGTSFGPGVAGSGPVDMRKNPIPGAVKKAAKGGKVEGGNADMAQDKALIKKAFRQHDAQEHKGSKGTKLKLAKGGSTASKRADGCATKGKTKGRFV